MTVHLASRYSASCGLASGDDAGDWQTRAVCREEDPELFFPVGGSPAALAQAKKAKKVCLRCPVIEQCEQWYTEQGITDGVWAGRSEQDRQAPKRSAERLRAQGILDDGRALALEHGRAILIALRQGQTAEDIELWSKARDVVVRQALRLLSPTGRLRNHGDPLERVMLNAGVLRDLVAAGRSDSDIAALLRTVPAKIPDARRLLSHLDAVAASAAGVAA